MIENNTKEEQLQLLLNQLEDELRLHNLWQAEKPSEDALASSLPFAIDRLTFVQWLQFVFIVKMRLLLQLKMPLPESIAVAPFAVEYFKSLKNQSTQIIALIRSIDLLINEKK